MPLIFMMCAKEIVVALWDPNGTALAKHRISANAVRWHGFRTHIFRKASDSV